MMMRALAIVTVLALGACSGQQGSTGNDGKSLALRTTSEAPGAHCADGGRRVETGVDDNGNGSLDDVEVDSTVYVCDGADGQGVVPALEGPGTNCPEGGVRLTASAGAPIFLCNGLPGETGAAGENVTVTPEPAGASCAHGGQRLQVGSGSPSYVCDGAPGATGAAGQSVAMTPEPAGANCTYGGQRLQVGGGSPAYVCDGAPGGTGPAGESVTMTPEPPGANCAFGGVVLQVGTGPVEYLCSGAPVGVTLPAVLTVEVTSIRYVEAVVNATVTGDGGEFILVRGVILATHAAPTIHDTVYFSGTGAGAFLTRCDGLEPNTTYFVRAFATNALGTSYGEERTFTTRALTVPALTTQDASSITNSTAIAGGDITDDGGTPILGRGICWGLAPDPTTAGTCASEGVGVGSFIALAGGLSSATTYHLRAYAANAQGTSYGEDRSFTTGVLPLATVTTAAPGAVSYTSATGGGTVVGDNGAPVTSRGICWATTPEPTTAGTCASEAGGVGSFTLSMTGLAASTTYHVRAYALNGGGTSYGADLTFATPTPAVPSLSTKAIGGISSDVAGSGGAISTDGGSPITAKGVCWSLNPNPTTANAKTSDGTGPASFNSMLTGLSPLTTYHVRAYATNALGTAYGNDVSFTTTDLVTPGPTVPVVGTSTSTISGSTTASSGGYVSRDGGSPVTARGVCWSTSPGPTLASACSTDGGTGVGFFASTITGLGGCGVVYYVRAYATNATGTGYGNQNTVSTGLLPTVDTAPVTAIGYFDATSGGAIGDDGGCAITQKGVAWSWTPNPTTGNPRTMEGTGDAPFVSSLTGLYANRTYYVRAYATNSVGTSYGSQVVFTTAEPSTPYLGQNFAGGIVFYVDGTGLHGLVSAPMDQGRAPWGCDGTSIPTGTALGTGATNTAAIVASCGQAGIAANVADSLVLNGYDDWFLPSRDELALMWSNLSTKGLAGFSTSNDYWSSSDAGPSSAWYVSFYDGAARTYPRWPTPLFRAVRAF